MKKLVAVCMVALMALAGCSNNGSSNGNGDANNGGSANAGKELVVATFDMNGDFHQSAGFGNSSYDKNVRDLIHGYSPVAFTSEGEWIVDETVIKELVKSEDADGNTVYTWTLNDGLKWNDGEPVTADDYVFAYLVGGSPQLVAAGASETLGENFVDYEAYHTGETDVLGGVKKVDDQTFSVTVSKDRLPYFWELSFMRVYPYPMHTLAPDATIESTDEGSKLVGDLAEAVNKFGSDYRFAPTVSCGPYSFISFENKQVKLVKNDNFAGTWDKKTPSIETIIVKTVNATLDVDMLVNGEVDIVQGVVEGDKIEKAKAAENVQESTYARNGFGNVPMHTDFGATKEKEVRHAIAYILDKDDLINNILGGYGTTVNSDYATAYWTYQVKKAELDSKLINYAFSIDKANAELDNSSYKFEADGVTPFDVTKAGEGYYRHNAAGEELVITHLGTNDNPVTDTIELQLKQNAPKVGIHFNIERTDFAGLLDAYYYGATKPEGERKYNTFNMASNFDDAPDPYYSSYACDFAGTPSNATNTCDPELDEIIQRLRHTPSEDTETFADIWVEYQVKWNDIMPMVPIYANQYYDFADADLNGFNTTPFASWAQIICDMSWK